MSSTTITPQPSFYGDYEKGEEPTNWLRKYELSLPTTATDTDKLSRFELQCAAASPAEIRWPQPTQVTLTVAQKKERIKAVVLKEEEIGVMIEEERGREWGHVRWAKKVARMAQGFNDTQCHLLDVVLDNTPEVLRDLLVDNYTSWTDFETDVAKVSAAQLLRAKQRLVMDRKLREDVDKLQNQTADERKAAQAPQQTVQAPYVSQPPYRYNYRYNPTMMPPPQSQTLVPPAPSMFQPPPTLMTPQVPQTPQAAHLFTQTAPVTRGNLFYGYRGYPQTPTRRGGSPADRMRTAAQTLATPTTPGPTSNVQFVSNATPTQYNMPQNSYPNPTAAYPQYSYFAEPYEAYQGAGNEFGPQQ
ncbi:hypothetical protein DEU56DRAFT_758862 [Suillus clintonianus]|uniref:uncharacterized protein n=1 Tax=Suillus clintonianus TaxID=1904413 RepID=UPI001B870966|nr:uncharacterized protein DEU56DRAFT_758862 [Suillus clintonianus]KAG2126617.1 hypothetical protein DEU56DRAFT_758862 [Suillus clintonianus]